jgi:hypothetical protein
MPREELYVADLVGNARAVREYLDGETLLLRDGDEVLELTERH